jgi:cholesterol oxidase
MYIYRLQAGNARSGEMPKNGAFDCDYVVIGSGFGGSVSALRLAEKGYSVLVLEKGRRLTAEDLPKTNWDLRRWIWLPQLRFHGLFQMTFFRHVTVMSGVGVGGGSLVYANTLPVPKPDFFRAESWSHLADWEAELRDFYPLGLRMLGANPNPRLETGDRVLREVAGQIGREDAFEPTNVAVYFGEPEVTVADPYFKGKGPARTGCRFCGGCMLGCRYDSKNTLDRNYLHLAERSGAEVRPETEACDVRPLDGAGGSAGYAVKWRPSTAWFGGAGGEVTCRGIVFAGGVLGTVSLLLDLKKRSLPRLSGRVGFGVRTNSESISAVTAPNRETVLSDGIAIGSILHTDEHSHLEPVRYPAGSGFWRLLAWPRARGSNVFIRLLRMIGDLIAHPLANLRVIFVDDWAKRTQILLFMQTLDSRLRLSKGILGLGTAVEAGADPTAFIPEADALAERFAGVVRGKPAALLTEIFLGSPTTAHVLGGCCMGRDAAEGVIDKDNRVFGYENMYVCDGSMISANPGVNPSLTIVALAERAMGGIPPNK